MNSSSGSSGNVVTVTLVSDVQCPWCYVGQRHLDEAVKQAGVPVEVRHEPFLVQDSHLDRFGCGDAGIPLLELLTRKYGASEAEAHFAEHHKRLASAGARVGVPFNTPWVDRVVRAFDAHRLIEWARAECEGQAGSSAEQREGGGDHRVNALVNALFRGYFTEGKLLNDHAFLADAAASSGFDRTAAVDMLTSDQFRAEVTERVEYWSRAGVSGVPLFIIEGPSDGSSSVARPTVLGGAQPIDTLTQVLRHHASGATTAGAQKSVSGEKNAAAAAAAAGVCTLDGKCS